MRTFACPATFLTHKHSAGFSLIELLVVISIIAVLISLLLPSLSKSRDVARNVYCTSGARGVQLGMDVYANDNKDYLPCDNDVDRNYAGILNDGSYVQGNIFSNKGGCPYGPTQALVNLTWWGNDYYSDATLTSISYGMPPVLQNGYGFAQPYVGPYYYKPNGRSRRGVGRIAQQGPAKNVYVTCSVTPWGSWSPYPGVALYHTLGVPTAYTPTLLGPTSSGFRERRHEGVGLPMVMGDGHGEFMLRENITAQGETSTYWFNNTVMASFSWRHNYNGTWFFGPSLIE